MAASYEDQEDEEDEDENEQIDYVIESFNNLKLNKPKTNLSDNLSNIENNSTKTAQSKAKKEEENTLFSNNPIAMSDVRTSKQVKITQLPASKNSITLTVAD